MESISSITIKQVGHATILIQYNNERIIIDPWLTERLDRFWIHYPNYDNIAIT